MAPRARFELATLRLTAEAVKISKCHIWRRLRDLKAIYSALELDGGWTEVLSLNPPLSCPEAATPLS